MRILDVRDNESGPSSFLGLAEGFPEVLVHAEKADEVERELVNALEGHFQRLMDHGSTRLELDDFPTVRVVRLQLCRPPA